MIQNSIRSLHARIGYVLKWSWIIFIMANVIFLLFFILINFWGLRNSSMLWKDYFLDRLHRVEKIVDAGGQPLSLLVVHTMTIDPNGVIQKTPSLLLRGKQLNSSGFFGKFNHLQPGQDAIVFFPDLEDGIQRVHFVKRLQNEFIVNSFEPDDFFPFSISEKMNQSVVTSSIIWFSDDSKQLGDLFQNYPLYFKSGRFYTSYSIRIPEMPDGLLVNTQDITNEMQILLLTMFILSLVFGSVSLQTLKVEKDFTILQAEHKSITQLIQTLSVVILHSGENMSARLENLMPVLRQSFRVAGDIPLQFEEHQQYRRLVQKFIEDMLALVDVVKDDRASLRESEARYRDLFNNANLAIFRNSMTGNILAVNPQFAQLFGFDSSEDVLVSKCNAAELFADPKRREEIIRLQTENPDLDTFENIYRRKDGSTFLGKLNVRKFVDQNTREVYYEGFIDDITEQKRMENLLRESETRFRTLVEESSEGVVLIDEEYKIIEWNSAQEKITGILREDAINASFWEIQHSLLPSDRKSQVSPHYFRDSMAIYKATGQLSGFSRTIETEIQTSTGERRYIFQVSFPIQSDSGFRIGAIMRDITERKHSEEQILQSEKKFRELFNINKDGISIFLLNPDGSYGAFVELNDAAFMMLGFTREEMLKLTPMLIEPTMTQEQMQLRQSECYAKGGISFETILLHKKGYPVFTEVTSQFIQFEEKSAIMNIVRDVSDRKQRESELRAISSLSAALRTAPTRAEMLPVIVSELSTLLHCDSVSAEMIDPITQEAVVEAAFGPWKTVIGLRQLPGSGLNGIISETRKPYHNNKLKEDPRIEFPKVLIRGIFAAAGVPLIAQDQLIGFLWIGRRNDIAESEVRLLASIADIAANAIRRATLYEQTQKDASNLSRAYDTTLEGWAHALELRDHETEGHARRVVQMTVDLAHAMGIDDGHAENVRRGALLHDIGKMGIPDSVLLKPGTLDEHEWNIMRRHPEYAYKLLEPIEYLRPVLNIPFCHHEKWDGGGYPRGLKGEEIPLEARIFAVVDVWDALTSERPYRSAWDTKKTLQYIIDQSGSHFDPRVVDRFLEMVQ